MAPTGSHPSSSLVLLPPAPSPPTYAAVKAAYHATLFTILRSLRSSASNADRPKVLEIALPCPHLYGQEQTPRTILYPTTQAVVANLYKLICILAVKEGIDVQDADGIDARIILVSYPRNGNLGSIAEKSAAEDLQGPVIDLPTLARCGRKWETVYGVETEQGEQVLKNFLLANSRYSSIIDKVRGGIVQVTTEGGPQTSQTGQKHFSVAVGGTWDHLHIGHKLLLTMTAFMVDNSDTSNSSPQRSLTCGITGDQLLVNKKFAEYLESWESRHKSVWDFYKSILDFTAPDASTAQIEEINDPGPNGHAIHIKLPSGLVIKNVEIWDPFGPTITDPSISALILSAETRAGGKAVNEKRAEKGWPCLEVLEVDVLDAEEESEDLTGGKKQLDESFQSKLSSTEIRRNQSEKAKARSKV